MKPANSYKAAITLVLVSAGYFLSYPFRDTFTGGLLASGCGAAMIGGLADWFAVTALFRKPLGIPFRTAIIPRNRDKIVEDMVSTVENELLTAENIARTLKDYNVAALLIRYAENRIWQAKIKQFVNRVIRAALLELSQAERRRVADIIVRNGLARLRLAPLLAQAAKWSLKSGYADKLFSFAIYELLLIVKRRETTAVVEEMIAEARLVYAKDQGARKLTGLAFDLLGFSSKKLAELAQTQCVAVLETMRNADHPARSRFKELIDSWIGRLLVDPAAQQAVEEWKKACLLDSEGIQPLIEDFWTGISKLSLIGQQPGFLAFRPYSRQAGAIKKIAGKGRSCAPAANWPDRQIKAWLAYIKDNHDLQRRVDNRVKTMVARFFEHKHYHIGRMVRDRLNAFSSEMLAAFIEEKVGNDLQMIRINGSIVGGGVGVLIFLARYWLTGQGV